jgi:hypothetical protein
VPRARRRAAMGGDSLPRFGRSLAGGKLPECAALAIFLQDALPEAIQILLDEVSFSWQETLGVPSNAANSPRLGQAPWPRQRNRRERRQPGRGP